MKRRTLLASAAALAAPRLSAAQSARVLKFIPEGDLPAIDPVWTTATNARNHGYLVFDTLYGQDSEYVMRPQMVAGHVIENDGRTWNITLRDGLKFHDGEPVRARDVVPSVRRFAARDAFGQALMEATDELSAVDDKTFRFRLKRPFPLLPNALGKTGTPMPAIMPERLAATDPAKQIPEAIGSGPFRFKADERVAGSRVVYERFAGYVPRPDGPATFTAGPKVVHFDRVEWQVIPDTSTATNALVTGEVDMWQSPTPDVVPLLKKGGKLAIEVLDPAGGIGCLRFNCLFPPFDRAEIRRALFGGIDQAEYMIAASGDDRAYWKDRVGIFCPGAPMANEAGIEVIAGPRDLEKVKRDLAAAGYKGEKVVMLGATDYPQTNALALVAADYLRRVGMNVDFQSIDWGTTVQRRAVRKPPDQGGWNIFFTYLNGTNNFDPAAQLGIRGNGDKAWFGWPSMPRMEELRTAWFNAPDLAAQKKICEEMQRQFWLDAPYIPLGVTYFPSAWKKEITGVRMGFPQFYEVKRG